jgi:hypothetical protein
MTNRPRFRDRNSTYSLFFLNQLLVSKLCKRPDCATLKPVLSDQLYNNSLHVKIEVMSVGLSNVIEMSNVVSVKGFNEMQFKQ